MFYELVCEDWTGLGGPMGTERTTTIFRKAFDSSEKAKEYAEKDHKKRDARQPIRWKKNKGRQWHSGDLLSHAYIITTRTVA